MSDEPKYRQRGYKDSERSTERSTERSGGAQGPREKKEGPRGRGLGAPTETAFRCGSCGERQAVSEVAADAVCGKCGQALHTCNNCMHFDTSTRWECRQTIPVRVAKKRDANSCALFAAKTVQEFGKERERANPRDARSAFDALFK